MSIKRHMRRKQRPDIISGFIVMPSKLQAAFWHEYDQEAPSEIIEIHSEEEQLELAELYKDISPLEILNEESLPLENIILVLRDVPEGNAAAILHYVVYPDFTEHLKKKTETMYVIGDVTVKVSNGGEISVPFGLNHDKTALAYSNAICHRGLEKKVLRAVINSTEFEELVRRATRIWQSLQMAAIKDKEWFKDLFVNTANTSKYTYKQGAETVFIKRYDLPVYELIRRQKQQ